MTVLINTLERVERSLYHALRLELVDKGYTPDALVVTTETTFEAALAAIKTVKGFAVEVFGVGSSQKKYGVKIPRIVILEEQRLTGALGGTPNPHHVPVLTGPAITSYLPTTTPPETKDLTYKISLVYQSAAEGRILHQILALALPSRGYIDWYDDVNNIEKIFVRQVGFSETSFTEEGYREAGYMYTVQDIWDTASAVGPAVYPITEITVDVRTGEEDQIDPDAQIVID